MPPLNSLFLQVNDFARNTPALHGPAADYAKYGLGIYAMLMIIGWWIARSRGSRIMAAALLAPVATIFAVVVQQLVVQFVDEPRPYTVHPDALLLISRNTDPSFPSDHACIAGAAAAALFFVNRWLGLIGAAGALLMAVDRVYVGAHWPLDVVAGLALGAGLAALVVLIARRPVAALIDRLNGTLLRPLLSASH